MRPGRCRRLRTMLAGGSLRVRVMATAAVLVAVTSAVTGLLGTVLLRDYLVNRADAQLRDFGSVAGSILARSHEPVRRAGQPGLPTQFLVEVVGPGGGVSVVGGPLHDADPPRLSGHLNGSSGPFTASGGQGHSWRVLIRSLPAGRHAVIAFSLDDINSTVTRLEVFDALAGAVAVALLAGIGLPLVRVSLAPLAKIENTAAAIAVGDLSQRIDHPSQGTEVGRLSGALNTMLGRIEAAYRAREEGEARALGSEDRMRQFVADASHELRTPLTSVRGLAEFSLQQGDVASRAELIRLMTLIQQEAARMGLLVEDLLMLAQLDEGCPLDRLPVDLSSIAAEAVTVARAVQPGRPITLHAAGLVIVHADAGRLRQVIDNLIRNALQHTPPISAVTVAVDSVAGLAQLVVADNGPGMTAEQASHVFERFYRTDDARSRARGGTGLGLSIAAALIAAQGGTITVATRPGHGAAFRVRLPLAAG